jgi:hypothetical protein
MRRALPVAILLLAVTGCDQKAKDPVRHPSAVEKRKIEIVRSAPLDGATYTQKAAIGADGGTRDKARDRLKREAEKAGCDVVVLTDEREEAATVRGAPARRIILEGDCLVRSGAEPR